MQNKQLLMIFFTCCFVNILHGQEIISTQGESLKNETITIDFTIGEPLNSTFPNQAIILTEGFQQSYQNIISTSTKDISKKIPFSFILSPNPASEFIEIKYQLVNSTNVTLKLFDATGTCLKILNKYKVKSGFQKEILVLDNYPSGLYFLSLSVDYDMMTKIFFIKN